MFNDPDFFTLRQLDIENKIILPTTELVSQVNFQLKALYQDIRSVLLDAHQVVAITAKRIYDHPVETMTAWYEQGANAATVLYAQAQTVVKPVYQNWQVQVNTSKENTTQYLRAFLDNPEQVTVATLEPVTRYVTAVTEKSGEYWQMFIANPEQFMVTALAPVTAYLSTLTHDAEAVLLSSYYALADLSSLLLAQPSLTVQVLYHNTLSALLDVYFDIISSLLVMT